MTTYKIYLDSSMGQSLDKVVTWLSAHASELDLLGVSEEQFEDSYGVQVACFSQLPAAERARELLQERFPLFDFSAPVDEPDQDWNAEWKRQFRDVRAGQWKVVHSREPVSRPGVIAINPGAGFGTGTHETTQLCLEALAVRPGQRVLDFGSGSGILAIAAAKMGGVVDAVEIDEASVENARENTALNGVSVEFHRTLPERSYDWVVANILRSTLVEFAEELVVRVEGTLVLSGLFREDEAEIRRVYEGLLSGYRSRAATKGEWLALCYDKFRP